MDVGPAPEEGQRETACQGAWRDPPTIRDSSSCNKGSFPETWKEREPDRGCGTAGPRRAGLGRGGSRSQGGRALTVRPLGPESSVSGQEAAPPQTPAASKSHLTGNFITAEECLKLFPRRLKASFQVT